MCGITGFYGHFEQSDLKKMTDAIAHRGPDGSGLWQEDNVGLGHRRLSIIDTSEAAAQPMLSHDDRYAVSFNGEVYNFKDLSADLISRGYSFNENSDTAILAPLYDAYGEKMLDKLEGIFAFAIYDRQTKGLFIARDHAGIKPLYYTETERGLAFSSELKSLLYLEDVAKDIDGEAMFSYLQYLWCPGERTMLSSIKKLLPGHYMAISASKEIEMNCWYDPPLPDKRISNKATHQELLDLIDETVNAQRISDVPLGSFLSGGVDSSAVVESMARQKDETFDAFCIGFEGIDFTSEGFSDDSTHAQKLADTVPQVNLHHLHVTPTLFEKLPEMIYHLDEPQTDPAPLLVQAICRDAKSRGIKVLMSGTGADDMFSGYRRHQAIQLQDKVRYIPAACRRTGLAFLEKIAPNNNLRRRLSKLKQLVENDLEKLLVDSYKYTPDMQLLTLLDDDLKEAFQHRMADHLELRLSMTEGTAGLERLLDLELHGFLPDHNLNYTDKLSMAEGVEVRVPFVTKEMKKLANRIPVGEKATVREAKCFMKKALEQRLPHGILYRSKTGFGAPIRIWLMGEALPWLKSIVLSDRLMHRGLFKRSAIESLIEDTRLDKVDGAYTLLTILTMELWFRQFVDSDVPIIERYM